MTTEKIVEISPRNVPRHIAPQSNKIPLGIALTFVGFILGIVVIICMMVNVAYWPTSNDDKNATMAGMYLQVVMTIAPSLSFLGLAIVLRNRLVKGGPKKTALVSDTNPLGLWVVIIGTIFGILFACLDVYLIWGSYNIENFYTDTYRLLSDIMSVLGNAAVPVQMSGLALICLITKPLKHAKADAALVIEVGGLAAFLVGIIGLSVIRSGDENDLGHYYSALSALTMMGGIFFLSGIGVIITRGVRFEDLGTWKALGLSICSFAMVPAVLHFADGIIYRNISSSVYYNYYDLNISTIMQNPAPLALIGLSIIFYAQKKKGAPVDLWMGRGLFFMVFGGLFYVMENYTLSALYSPYGSNYFLFFTLVWDGFNNIGTLILIIGLGLIIWRSGQTKKASASECPPSEPPIPVQEEPVHWTSGNEMDHKV